MKKLRLGGIFAAFALSVVSMATMCSENEPKKPQLPSWGIIFTPSTIGQVALHNYRGNMVTYLQENEKAAQEGVKRFLGLSEERWQKVRAKKDADKEANKKALRQPGNNFNSIHHPEITSDPMYSILREECAVQGTNPYSFHIGINENPGALAHTQVNSMQTQGSISGMNMHFSSFLRNEMPLFVKRHVIGHEHWHLVEQHGLERDVHQHVLAVMKEDASQINNKSNAIVKCFEDQNKKLESENKKIFLFRDLIKMEESVRQQFVLLKEMEELQKEADVFQKDCIIINDRLPKYHTSAEFEQLTAAQEKTADTRPSCTDQNAAKNSRLSYVTNSIGYEKNKEDVLEVATSWDMTKAIDKKDRAMKKIEHNRQKYLVKPAGQCTIL